jgi:hypothetical protein
MEWIVFFMHFVYNYCMDFIIALTRITGLSYYDVNALFFIVFWPLMSIMLPLILLYQKFVLRKKKIDISKTH